MPVNADKPNRWKNDIAQSVDFYNDWFIRFAPQTFRETRQTTTEEVERALEQTAYLKRVTADILRQHPGVLETLRMATAPPIARDRLIGLAGVSPNLVKNMEIYRRIPPRMPLDALDAELDKLIRVIARMADPDIFPWLTRPTEPEASEIRRAATIVADRLTGAQADPIIRNAQERRQLAAIRTWLETRGYTYIEPGHGATVEDLQPGAFAFRLNVMGARENGSDITIPTDAVIMPRAAATGDFPLLIEAKSAGDFTNTNKRRKEEATKIAQLRRKHGNRVRYVLFLCGYFDSGYLGYEAAEGIDWVWEHRMDELSAFEL